jgi:hypothetical protein
MKRIEGSKRKLNASGNVECQRAAERGATTADEPRLSVAWPALAADERNPIPQTVAKQSGANCLVHSIINFHGVSSAEDLHPEVRKKVSKKKSLEHLYELLSSLGSTSVNEHFVGTSRHFETFQEAAAWMMQQGNCCAILNVCLAGCETRHGPAKQNHFVTLCSNGANVFLLDSIDGSVQPVHGNLSTKLYNLDDGVVDGPIVCTLLEWSREPPIVIDIVDDEGKEESGGGGRKRRHA